MNRNSERSGPINMEWQSSQPSSGCSSLTDIDRLIQSFEFENQQCVKLIEKETQHIEALERSIEESKSNTVKLQETVSQLDEDTKQAHKQFTLNRDNCESLKKTMLVLKDHEEALLRKHTSVEETAKQERCRREETLKHYLSLWEDYERKYQEFPLAKELRHKQAKVSDLKTELCHAESQIDNLKSQIKTWNEENCTDLLDMKNFILKLAKLKVDTEKVVNCINDMTEEKRKLEVMRANRTNSIVEKNTEDTMQVETCDDKEAQDDSNVEITDIHIDITEPQPVVDRDASQQPSNDVSPLISMFCNKDESDEMLTEVIHAQISDPVASNQQLKNSENHRQVQTNSVQLSNPFQPNKNTSQMSVVNRRSVPENSVAQRTCPKVSLPNVSLASRYFNHTTNQISVQQNNNSKPGIVDQPISPCQSTDATFKMPNSTAGSLTNMPAQSLSRPSIPRVQPFINTAVSQSRATVPRQQIGQMHPLPNIDNRSSKQCYKPKPQENQPQIVPQPQNAPKFLPSIKEQSSLKIPHIPSSKQNQVVNMPHTQMKISSNVSVPKQNAVVNMPRMQQNVALNMPQFQKDVTMTHSLPSTANAQFTQKNTAQNSHGNISNVLQMRPQQNAVSNIHQHVTPKVSLQQQVKSQQSTPSVIPSLVAESVGTAARSSFSKSSSNQQSPCSPETSQISSQPKTPKTPEESEPLSNSPFDLGKHHQKRKLLAQSPIPYSYNSRMMFSPHQDFEKQDTISSFFGGNATSPDMGEFGKGDSFNFGGETQKSSSKNDNSFMSSFNFGGDSQKNNSKNENNSFMSLFGDGDNLNQGSGFSFGGTSSDKSGDKTLMSLFGGGDMTEDSGIQETSFSFSFGGGKDKTDSPMGFSLFK